MYRKYVISLQIGAAHTVRNNYYYQSYNAQNRAFYLSQFKLSSDFRLNANGLVNKFSSPVLKICKKFQSFQNSNLDESRKNEPSGGIVTN